MSAEIQAALIPITCSRLVNRKTSEGGEARSYLGTGWRAINCGDFAMRRKLTEPSNAGAELPELTAQQAKFVEGILGGKGTVEAYRAAYDCSTMQQNTIWSAASALKSHYKIAMWLAAARKAELGHAVVTKDQHIRRLDALKQRCIDEGNLGAAVQCEQLIGKVEGHYVDRLEVAHKDPLEALEALRHEFPEIAAQLAKDAGIDWETRH